MALGETNPNTKELKYRVVLPITVWDDDEFGGFPRNRFVEVWSGNELRPISDDERHHIRDRSLVAQADPSSLGPDVIKVESHVELQTRRNIPRGVGRLAAYFGLEWKTIPAPPYFLY